MGLKGRKIQTFQNFEKNLILEFEADYKVGPFVKGKHEHDHCETKIQNTNQTCCTCKMTFIPFGRV